MKLEKRLEAIEAAMAKRNGDTARRIVVKMDDESEGGALARVGLAGFDGPSQVIEVVFVGPADIDL